MTLATGLTLVVNVIAKARQDNVHDQGLSAVLFRGGRPLFLQGWQFVNDDKGDGAQKGNNIHDGIDVGGVHVFALVGLERLCDGRSKFTLESSRGVGHGSVQKGFDVNVDPLSFLDAGQTDTADNGNQHEVGQKWLDIGRGYQDTHDGGKDGFTGLDNLLKGDSSDGSSQYGSAVG